MPAPHGFQEEGRDPLDANVTREDAVVVGVDFGTLSGRALVVRVADGTELGTATHEYAHAVLDDALPSGTPLAPDWALQVPEDYREVLRTAVPAAVADAGIDPTQVIGIATDFTACTMVPTTRRRNAAVRDRGVRRPPARLRQAVAPPRRAGAGRPDQRAWPRPAARRGSRATAG